MDVLQAAWKAAGFPRPTELPFETTGRCARCGQLQLLTPAAGVVSAKWTGWSTWQTASRPALCAACTWGYRTPAHRQGALLVTAVPELTLLTAAGLVQALSRPAEAGTAVVLPVRLNRKHGLPVAQWGRVTIDDVPVPWTAGDVQRFTVAVRLRSWGFTSRALAQPAPEFRTLTALPTRDRRQVMSLWPELAPWRPATPWLIGACVAAGMYVTAAAA